MAKAVVLPRGVDQETFDKALAIIKSGYEAEQTPDTIKGAMFTEGIKFSLLTRLFQNISVGQGFVLDPKVLKGKVEKLVAAKKFKFTESYEDLIVFVGKVQEKAKGASTSRVLSEVKKIFLADEKDFPRKPAPVRGRMGPVIKAIVNLFAENPKATPADCEAVLKPIVKKDGGEVAYTKKYYKMAYALSHQLTANKALTLLSGDATPEDDTDADADADTDTDTNGADGADD